MMPRPGLTSTAPRIQQQHCSALARLACRINREQQGGMINGAAAVTVNFVLVQHHQSHLHPPYPQLSQAGT